MVSRLDRGPRHGRARIMSKYRAQRTDVDGITFDSKAEARRYSQLKLLETAREIKDLELQPSYPIQIEGVKVCTYKADFTYLDRLTGKRVVEDVKGFKTPVYRLKKTLVKAMYRSDERGVGQGCGSTCNSRWSRSPK